MREVARRFGVALSTVQWWVKRAGRQRLDRVDWTTHPPIAHHIHRTPLEIENLVLWLRAELETCSDLGEHGADAIHAALRRRGVDPPPARSTIGRILVRRGVLDAWARVRRPAPPRGWYLPEVAAGAAELDSFDVIEGLKIQDGPVVEILTGISLHGGLVAAWPREQVTARLVVHALMAHWRQVGRPGYAQFDNDTRFQGAHQHRDSIGRVMRLCLSLGIVPVFVPPREPGFQAAIESFNGRWQAKVWARFHHDSLASLEDRSARYCHALLERLRPRLEAAPPRPPVPATWQLDLQAPPQGRLIYVRRTGEQGTVTLLGRTFAVDSAWVHRLVRCEVHLTHHHIRFFALRRRAPHVQPLLREVPYQLPLRRFHD